MTGPSESLLPVDRREASAAATWWVAGMTDPGELRHDGPLEGTAAASPTEVQA